MTISELEEEFQQLHEQLLRGELDDEAFQAEVELLRFEDDQGRLWKIGWYTGQWYWYDRGKWVKGKPRERQEPDKPVAAAGASGGMGRVRRPVTHLLVAGLVSLLLIALVVLVAGWDTEWWTGPTMNAISAANTPQATPPRVESPRAATSTPTAPAPIAQVTLTPSRTPVSQASPTARPTPVPSRTPTARPTQPPTQTPTLSPTATPTSQATPTPPPQSASGGSPALTGRIFFPVYDANPDRRTMDIHAIELASGERDIIVGQASQPALSPNGKRLAYRSWDQAQRGILVRELDDGHTWVWINFTEAARPSWSPDSQSIVFPSQQESDRQWRLYRTLGLEFDRVRRHGGDILGRTPVWLADGRIVYWECPLSKCGLYVMQRDGTAPFRLTTDEHDTAPAASPDGSQVAFMTKRDGNWEIYVVSAYPAEAREQGIRRLTRNPARDGLPTWSPDGQWLAFVTDRDGAWAVWVMRPDGSGQRKLFELGGPLEGEIAHAPAEDQHGWTWETLAWGP